MCEVAKSAVFGNNERPFERFFGHIIGHLDPSPGHKKSTTIMKNLSGQAWSGSVSLVVYVGPIAILSWGRSSERI